MGAPGQIDPGVRRARENIGALKAAIRKEKGTLADYQQRLETGRGGYPEAGLRHGIERTEHNISVLKDAIIQEKGNIRSMEGQKRISEEMAELKTRVQIPVEYVNEGEDGGGGEHGSSH